MSVIDEVKQKTDIADVIGQYAKLTKAGRNLRALCPFHSEKQPSFFVYPERQSWHCFGACNTGGDVFAFIMRKEGVSFGDALRLLAERAGITVPSRFEPDAGKDERDKLFQVNQAAAQYYHNLLLNSAAGKHARDYISKRGLSEKTVTGFQLGYSLDSWDALIKYLGERSYTENDLLAAGLVVKSDTGRIHDRFRNRLMFPIQDARGRFIGFGARELDGSMPKYLNSPQTPVFDKSGTLFAMHQARTAIRQQDLVVIVEGYMDVITAHQYGFTNVVASMGTAITDKHLTGAIGDDDYTEETAEKDITKAITDKHLNDIKRLTRNVTLALDSDSAGQEAMLRCVGYEKLLGTEIKVAVLPEGKDPDDFIKEDAAGWQELLEKALPVLDFTIQRVTQGLDFTDDRDRSLALSSLLPLLNEIKRVELLDLYINKLSNLTGIPYRTIERALSNYRADQRAVRLKREQERPRKSALSSPREEYCLALLLKYQELKAWAYAIKPEYFQNSENREIFLAWQGAGDASALENMLEPAIREYLAYLRAKDIPVSQIEQKLADCVVGLRETYYRSIELDKGEILSAEREVGGDEAELAKLLEQGIDASVQLGEVFRQRGKGTLSKEARNAG
jgi:DNA primase